MRRGHIRFVLGLGSLIAALTLVYFAWTKYQATRVAQIWIGGDVHYGATIPQLGLPVEGIGIVNLEGPVVEGDASKSDEKRLVNSVSGLRALAHAGVRVVGIANNHSRDVTPNETSKYVRTANLQPVGGEKEGPGGIAGFTSIATPAGRIVIVAYEAGGGMRSSVLQNEIEAASNQGDFLIATFHVTGPPSYIPRQEVRNSVETALRAGARVVALHGTHALGPVERRPDGSVIAWGLGNLLFACACSREKEGAILELTINRQGKIDAAIVPIEAGLDGQPSKLDPDAKITFDLLDSIKSSPLKREGPRAHF